MNSKLLHIINVERLKCCHIQAKCLFAREMFYLQVFRATFTIQSMNHLSAILTLSWRRRLSYRNQSICSANQWTGFYMITASVMKEFNKTFQLLTPLKRSRSSHWRWTIKKAVGLQFGWKRDSDIGVSLWILPDY